MDGSWSPPAKRRSLRVTVEAPVTIERVGAHFEGRVANIGFGGAFIQSAARFVYGERLTLWIPIVDLVRPSCVPSLVRWSDQVGFGVQFLELGAREAHALSQLIKGAEVDDRPTLPCDDEEFGRPIRV